MNSFKRVLVFVLVFSVLSLHFPEIFLGGQGHFFAQAATTAGITGHTPEVLAPPEEKIPVEKALKKKNNWLWIAAGVVLLGGLAAAAAGGGGGGDHGGAAPPPPTGDVKVGW